MDIRLSPQAFTAIPKGLGTPSNSAAIPENETFHSTLQSAAGKTDTPEKIAGVAKQFEALMIGQMLRTAHESSSGSLDGGNAASSDTMYDVAAQQFAQVLAANGGLGLAKMILKGLQGK